MPVPIGDGHDSQTRHHNHSRAPKYWWHRILDITNDSTKIVDFLVPNNSATQTEATNPNELESILVRVSEYEQCRGEIQFKRGALGTKVSASTESTRTRKISSATTQNSTSLSVMRVHNSHRVAKSL